MKRKIKIFGIIKILMMTYASVTFADGGQHILFPKAANVPSVIDYGAVPNDGNDDTLAFQNALQKNHKLLFVPNGTYIIADTLRWGKGEKRQVLQGESESGTILQLKDHAQNFQNPAKPQPVIWTGKAPAQRFRNGIHNLTIDIGMDNPGAIGVQFIANNQGGLEYVTIRDRSELGQIGLDLGYTNEQGPCLIKHVTVEGFEIGVSFVHAVDSVTVEHMTLINQRSVGLRNLGQVVNIRGLISRNHVPAILNTGASLLTLIDSKLTGEKADDTAAIINKAGLFARNIKTTGYALAINNSSGNERDAKGEEIGEYVSHDVLSLFPSPPKSLNLPIKDTPEVEWDPVDKWVNVEDFGPPKPIVLPRIFDDKKFKTTDWTPALQKAIDSGATTIYFPCTKGSVNLFGKIYLRKNVKRIIGLENSGYYMSPSTHLKSMFPDQYTPVFVLEDGTAPVVVIERFDTWYTPFVFQQNSNRTLVVHSLSFYDLQIKNNGGDVFLDDVRAKQVVVNKESHVWGRQINPEGKEEPRILVNGGTMWILGLKTEDDNTVAKTENGGKLEICGGFIYANKNRLWPKQMFINDGGSLSATVGEWVSKRDSPFNILVEKRDGEERIMKRRTIYARGTGSLVPLLVSYRIPANAKPQALASVSVDPLGTDRAKANWEKPKGSCDGVILRVKKEGRIVQERIVSVERPEAILTDLKAGQSYEVEVSTFNGAGESAPVSAKLSLPTRLPSGKGSGLQGVYFHSMDLERPMFTREDKVIDFQWNGGSPGKGLNKDRFSVRWTGLLESPVGENVTFIVNADDALRLWVGKDLLIDKWWYARRASAKKLLEMGKKYPIRIEYAERGGKASISLEWASTNMPREVIPTSQLYPQPLQLPTVKMAESKLMVKENDKPIKVEFQRDGDLSKVLRVELDIDGSATAGIDYEMPAQATFQPEQTTSTVEFKPIDDKRCEPNIKVTIAPKVSSDYFTVGSGLTITLIDDDMPSPGQGNGLNAQYFNTMQFSEPVGSRIDKMIDFGWHKKPPFKGVGTKTYSIRWTGEIQPLFSEDYTFTASITKYGGVKVIIDGKTIIDAWKGPLKSTTRGTINLIAGKKYPITVEYRNERDYGSNIHLFWSSSSQFRQVVPTLQLYSVKLKD